MAKDKWVWLGVAPGGTLLDEGNTVSHLTIWHELIDGLCDRDVLPCWKLLQMAHISVCSSSKTTMWSSQSNILKRVCNLLHRSCYSKSIFVILIPLDTLSAGPSIYLAWYRSVNLFPNSSQPPFYFLFVYYILKILHPCPHFNFLFGLQLAVPSLLSTSLVNTD